MKDYVLGYRTYVERRFGKQSIHERSKRSLAYLPVVVRGEEGNHFYAAIKDISNTGLHRQEISLPSKLLLTSFSGGQDIEGKS
jgi:hypothetical protein